MLNPLDRLMDFAERIGYVNSRLRHFVDLEKRGLIDGHAACAWSFWIAERKRIVQEIKECYT